MTRYDTHTPIVCITSKVRCLRTHARRTLPTRRLPGATCAVDKGLVVLRVEKQERGERSVCVSGRRAVAELTRKGVRRDTRCAHGSKDPERRRGGTRASCGRRDGSNRRRMGGKAPLQEPEGVRSALLDSTRTFTKPMSLAYSRKHCLQMFRLYLRMIPHWFPHTRLLKRRGGEGQDRSLGRVESGRNVETLEIGAACRASRDGFEPPVQPDDARSSRACHACSDCPSIASRDRRAWRRGRRAGKPPDRRVRGKNTLPEGAPEAGDGDRTRHAPATLALAVALLLGSPDVSETHVCSEVCDACGATLKGLPGGRKVREKLHPRRTRVAHNHYKSFPAASFCERFL